MRSIPLWEREAVASTHAHQLELLGLSHVTRPSFSLLYTCNAVSAGEIYLAADDKPLTREQICAEAINAPRFEGKVPPAFTGPTGGGVDYGGKGTGKVLDCSATRKALDWQPIYPTFGAFIKTLTSE